MKLLFVIIGVFALPVFSAYDTLWTKTFARPGNDNVYCIKHLTDGSLVMAGSVTDTTTHQYDAAIMKTDSTGRQTWLKIYGTAQNSEELRWVEPVSGGFVAVGTGHAGASVRQKVWVLFLDASGDTTKTVFLGDTLRDYSGYCIRQTADKGFVIAATAALTNYFGTTYSLAAVRLSADGSVQWQKRFDASDIYGTVLGRGIVELATGQIVVAGGTGFLRLNSAGDSLRVGTYVTWVNGHGAYSVTVNGIDKTPDGKFVLVGSSYDTTSHQNFSYPYYNIWLDKMDTNGAESWTRTIGSPAYSTNDYGYSVETQPDSGFLVTGAFGGQGWAGKIQSNGTVAWSVLTGGSAAYSACAAGTDNFMAAGAVSASAPVNTDMYLARIGQVATSAFVQKSTAAIRHPVLQHRIMYTINSPGCRIVTTNGLFECNGRRTGETSSKDLKLKIKN